MPWSESPRSDIARRDGARRGPSAARAVRRSSRSTLVLTAAFVLAGAAFDSPTLYVPGIALAGVAAAARAWVGLAARRTRLECLPGPWSVVEGEPCRLRV